MDATLVLPHHQVKTRDKFVLCFGSLTLGLEAITKDKFILRFVFLTLSLQAISKDKFILHFGSLTLTKPSQRISSFCPVDLSPSVADVHLGEFLKVHVAQLNGALPRSKHAMQTASHQLVP